MIAFVVPGVPATAGSKRAFVYTPKGGGKARAVVVDDAQKTGKPWRASIQAAALEARQGQPLLEGALELEVTFVMPRPRGHYDQHGKIRRSKLDALPIVRPDVDKLSRALLDSLKAIVWHDDAQVVTKIARKRYESGTLTVGARVIVRPVHLFDEAQAVGMLRVEDVDQDREPIGTSASLPGLD